jgi:hypothetical protein
VSRLPSRDQTDESYGTSCRALNLINMQMSECLRDLLRYIYRNIDYCPLARPAPRAAPLVGPSADHRDQTPRRATLHI